jgi:UDP-N-acetylmuramate dehydrogenase
MCRFGYRTSVFKEKKEGEIILEASFKLVPGKAKDIQSSIDEKITYRVTRHPINYPNIGSIFKNVPLDSIKPKFRKNLMHVVKHDPFPVVPAAYLIAMANLSGINSGGAMISPKHPNFIVNAAYAEAEDVLNLIALVKDEVKRAFGVVLEEEVMKL